jgi:hypothetical protein
MSKLNAAHIKEMFNDQASHDDLFQTVTDLKEVLAQNALNIALLKSKIETLEHDASYLSLFLELLIIRLESKVPKESALQDPPE